MNSLFWVETDHQLTGQVRYRSSVERVSLFETRPILVAEVQERYVARRAGQPENEGTAFLHWRDMQTTDLQFLRKQE
jgi:hypothetical protein